ncbi:MAG: hypothetical protein M3Y72_09935 [Acidobacteriota bacterium]|nr:hypothetical protein [Acidobacteriota bacterium]
MFTFGEEEIAIEAVVAQGRVPIIGNQSLAVEAIEKALLIPQIKVEFLADLEDLQLFKFHFGNVCASEGSPTLVSRYGTWLRVPQ